MMDEEDLRLPCRLDNLLIMNLLLVDILRLYPNRLKVRRLKLSPLMHLLHLQSLMTHYRDNLTHPQTYPNGSTHGPRNNNYMPNYDVNADDSP